MPPGLASLVLQAQVLFTVLIASLALGERPSRRELLAVLVGAAGLVVVVFGRSAATPLVALVLTLAAAASPGRSAIVPSRRSAPPPGCR